MFTVLHKSGGYETLYPCAALTYRGPLASHGPYGVDVLRTDGATTLLTDGSVFIMNEAGATVAKYELPMTAQSSGQVGGNNIKAVSAY